MKFGLTLAYIYNTNLKNLDCQTGTDSAIGYYYRLVRRGLCLVPDGSRIFSTMTV